MSRDQWLKQMSARANEYGLRLVSLTGERFILVDNNQPPLTNIYGEELIDERREFDREELTAFLDNLDGTAEEEIL